MHILSHTVAGYKSAPHSVFAGARHLVFATLDEALTKPRLVAYKSDGVTPDPLAFIADMGREVGTAGERYIRVVFSGSVADKRIITAYPVNYP